MVSEVIPVLEPAPTQNNPVIPIVVGGLAVIVCGGAFVFLKKKGK